MSNTIGKLTEPTEKRFLLLGESGSGKSTFINYLTNYFHGTDDIKKIQKDPTQLCLAIPVKNWEKSVGTGFLSNEKNIDDQTSSQTAECCEYTFDYNEKIKFSFIDTPGINDTNGSGFDGVNVQKIISAVLNKSHLNGVIILINGTVSRLTLNMQNLLSTLKGFIPSEILDNSVVIFTNCDENSMNFDEKCLKGILKYRNKFAMQNSFFKWNRKGWLDQYVLDDWNRSNRMIASMIDKYLINMKSITTDTFTMTEELAEKLTDHILKQMQDIIELSQKIDKIKIEKISLGNALKTIEENLVHEKKIQIHGIPIVDALKSVKPETKTIQPNKNGNKKRPSNKNEEQTKVSNENNEQTKRTIDDVKRPKSTDSQRLKDTTNKESKTDDSKMQLVNVQMYDNVAIEKHKQASLEAEEFKNKIQTLDKKVCKLKHQIDKKFDNIGKTVGQLKGLCKGFNISQHLKDTIGKFHQITNAQGNDSCLHEYYNRLLEVLNVK